MQQIFENLSEAFLYMFIMSAFAWGAGSVVLVMVDSFVSDEDKQQKWRKIVWGSVLVITFFLGALGALRRQF